MKIVLDDVKKDLVLLKKDGTEVSRYPYVGSINDEFTVEDLRKDIDSFNITVGQQEEFDNIKGLSHPAKIHNWD